MKSIPDLDRAQILEFKVNGTLLKQAQAMLKKIKSFRERKGLETVEVAITLPLLTLAMFSTIQINHRWHVEKMLKLATYEAIKAGGDTDGDSIAAITTFNEHAAALGIQGAALDMDATSFNNANTGDYIWLRGTAPAASNRFPAPITLDLDPSMSCGTVWYRKEGL